MSVLTIDTYEPEQSGETRLWIVAAIIVVAIHIALAVAYVRFKPEPEMQAEAPAIDVAFMPATDAPAQPPSIDQPEPTKMEQPKDDALPPPMPELQPPPPPPPQVEAMVPHEEPPPAPAIPVQPEPSPVPEEHAVVVPQEKPPEVKPVPEKPVVPAQPHKVAHEEKVEKKPPPKSVAAPGAKPMRVASAPNLGVESEGARVGRESWSSEFAARIQRAATYATNGNKETGTAQVSVTVDRNGRLLVHRIAHTAGSATLDQHALSIIERAAPFPHFPASMPEAQITRMVPIHLKPQ